MRLAVFTFSLVLIFAPVYAYAFIPFIAARGLIAKTASGVYKKIPSKRQLLFATGTSSPFMYKWCTSNKKCKEILGEVEDFLGLDDDDSKDCVGVIYFLGSGNKSTNLDDIVTAEVNKAIENARKDYPTTQYVSHSQDFSDLINNANSAINKRKELTVQSTSTNIYSYRKQQIIDTNVTIGNSTINRKIAYSVGVTASYLCNDDIPDDKKQEMQTEKEQIKKEQIQKIVQNMSDDDITYIINNYRDDIDIDKYCAESGSCDELSKEFGDDVTKNKGKYDIDKINKANCLVENGKIVSCDNAKLEKDEKNQENTEDESNTEETTDKTNCDDNASAFHKKVCEFIDWYQSDEYQEQDTKIDFGDDKPKTSNKELDFIGACPTPYQLEFKIDFGSIGSYDVNLMLFDSLKVCGFLDTWVKPIMMFLGPLHAIYILGRNE